MATAMKGLTERPATHETGFGFCQRNNTALCAYTMELNTSPYYIVCIQFTKQHKSCEELNTPPKETLQIYDKLSKATLVSYMLQKHTQTTYFWRI